jgi:N-acetylmuramoyl-L-alanine amidase
MKIIIDPGHGGKDPGACGEFSQEKDITLKIGIMLYSLLKMYENYEVEMTRERDTYPTWVRRVKSEAEDIFISIHCNATVNKEVNGIETFHYPNSEQGERLANLIQSKLIAATNQKDRGVKSEEGLYVLRKTKCPSVLVECGFISNPEGEKSLNEAKYQYLLALTILEGIKEYLEGE